MILLPIAIVLLLVLLNGLFAMTELAVVSSRRAKLQARADKGDAGARVALSLSEEPTRFLSAVQVGITLIGILAGAYGQASIAGELDRMLETTALARWSEAISTGVVVVLITYFSLILGELVPKRLALSAPERLASVMAPPIALLAKVLHPFVTLLTFSTSAVLRLLRVRDQDGSEVSQEEIETTLSAGTSAGLIEPEEQQMIGEVLRLGDRAVRAAMTPRRDVFWISLADPDDALRAEIRACPYARMVVSESDQVDEPIGVIHKKDVLDALLDGGALDLRPLLQTPVFVPDSATVLNAMDALKRTPVHMAFVVDEFGAFQGVVTPTDLLEMIAGDFPEAHDAPGASTVEPQEDGSFIVDGRTDVEDLQHALETEFDADAGYHTAGGLVLDAFGRLPTQGETVDVPGWRVEVIEMDDRRVGKLRFTPAGEGPPAR